jgi:spermidine synthase
MTFPAKRPTLRTLRTPFTPPRTVLRMLESPDEDKRTLLRRLLIGTYQKPFLIEDSVERTLEFSLTGGSQSSMHCADPDALIVPYTREMMAFLLLCPNPRHVVAAGLGGGSLVKYCHRYLPETRITAIEINPWVISLRDEFRIPADDGRLTTVCADARDYFASPAPPADVVLIDLYDRRGAAPFMRDRAFLRSVRSHLTTTGCVVFNAAGTDAWCRECTTAVRAVFGNPIVAARVEPDGNLVLLAFNGSAAASALNASESRSEEVEKRFELEFPAFWRALQ